MSAGNDGNARQQYCNWRPRKPTACLSYNKYKWWKAPYNRTHLKSGQPLLSCVMTGTDHFGMVEVQHAPSKGNILEGSPNNWSLESVVWSEKIISKSVVLLDLSGSPIKATVMSFLKCSVSCSLNVCSLSYSICLCRKRLPCPALFWIKYVNFYSYCETSSARNSNWDKKFGWVFDKVAILRSNLKFALSICKPQQQGPNPVQLKF